MIQTTTQTRKTNVRHKSDDLGFKMDDLWKKTSVGSHVLASECEISPPPSNSKVWSFPLKPFGPKLQ